MLKQGKPQIKIEIQHGRLHLSANFVITIRKMFLVLLLLALIGLLMLASLDAGLKKYILEIALGILQSVLANYISHK